MIVPSRYGDMKKVKTHRYAQPNGTSLYDGVDGVQLCVLEGGSWMGIVSETNGWYRVNTALQDGWVRIGDTVNAKPFTLSAIISAKVSGLIQNYILL
jgi:hypothetical protein